MSLLAWLRASPSPEPVAWSARHDALAAAAVALAELRLDDDVEPVLRVTVAAAREMSGAGTALVVSDGDGRAERLVADGVDRSTRDTIVRAEVLGALLRRLGTADGPLDVDAIEPGTARSLAAVAPRALVFAVGRNAMLAVVPPTDEPVTTDTRAVLGVLARLAAGALEIANVSAAQRATCEELRRLCTAILARQDEEAGRTAREVHEGICQRLAAANAQLEVLGGLVDGRGDARACLRDARALVNQSLGELRELAQRLRPAVLEHLGYVEALRWYLGRLRARDGLAPSLEVEGSETRLPVAIETALYRATEQALRAAAEMPGKRRVRVRYRRDPGGVRIEIAGPSPEAVDLVAMRERLRPFGGAVLVSAAADEAPVIEVKLPAPAAAALD